MDYDRKSTVSSFYGARRSGDALNTDFPIPAGAAPPARPRADSSSSFYGSANRHSRADYEAAGGPGAGYNQNSYFDAGRTEPLKGDGAEEAAWDVYADFNNAGPRYSTAFGMGDTGYRQVPSPTPYSPQTAGYAKPSTASLTEQQPGGVEMVTVPALGPEWKAEELHDMSKKAKREERLEKISSRWKSWRRDEGGLCGRWFSRKFTAWFIFGLCAAIAIVLAFTIPRVPSFSTNQSEPLSPATAPFNKTIPTEFSRSPANFSFPGMMKLQADTGSNYLPLKFKNIHASLFDLTTGRQVGSGDTGHLSLPAKKFPIVQLNLNFTYSAVNDSDITWANWYNGCKNKILDTDGVRPAVQYILNLDMKIEGLIGTKHASTTVKEATCPIELPSDSV